MAAVGHPRAAGLAALAGFCLTIPLANWWLDHYGFWHVPGLGPVASGVIWVGLSFVLRDLGQLLSGRSYAWVAIAVGTWLSWWLATPSLAVASGIAFVISESTDALIFTPLANRGRFLLGVTISGYAASAIDSAVFLRLAFHSYSGWWQLAVFKALIVAAATPAAWAVRRALAPRLAVAPGR